MSISGFSQPQLSGLQIGRTSINGATIQSDGPSIYDELKNIKKETIFNQIKFQIETGFNSLIKINNMMLNTLIGISSKLDDQLQLSSKDSNPVHDTSAMFMRWSGGVSRDIRTDTLEMTDEIFGRFNRNLSSLEGNLFDLMDPKGPIFRLIHESVGTFNKYFNMKQSLEESLFKVGSKDSKIIKEMESMANRMRLPFEVARLLSTPSTLIMQRYDHPDSQQVALLGAIFDVTREVALYQIAQAKLIGVDPSNIRRKVIKQTFLEDFIDKLNATPVIGNLYRISKALLTLSPITSLMKTAYSLISGLAKIREGLTDFIGDGIKSVVKVVKDTINLTTQQGRSDFINASKNLLKRIVGFEYTDKRSVKDILKETGVFKEVTVKVQDATLQIPLLLEPIRNNTEKTVNFLEAIYQTLIECCKNKLDPDKRDDVDKKLFSSLKSDRVWDQLSGQFMTQKEFEEARRKENEKIQLNIKTNVQANKSIFQKITEQLADNDLLGTSIKSYINDERAKADLINKKIKISETAQEEYDSRLDEYYKQLDESLEKEIELEKKQINELVEIKNDLKRIGKLFLTVGAATAIPAIPLLNEIPELLGSIATSFTEGLGSLGLSISSGLISGVQGNIYEAAVNLITPDIITNTFSETILPFVNTTIEPALKTITDGTTSVISSILPEVIKSIPDTIASGVNTVIGTLILSHGFGELINNINDNQTDINELQRKKNYLETIKNTNTTVLSSSDISNFQNERNVHLLTLDDAKMLSKNEAEINRNKLSELQNKLANQSLEENRIQTQNEINEITSILNEHQNQLNIRSRLEDIKMELLRTTYDVNTNTFTDIENELTRINNEISTNQNPSITSRLSRLVISSLSSLHTPTVSRATGGAITENVRYLVGDSNKGPELGLFTKPTIIENSTGYIFNPDETKELLKQENLISRANGGVIVNNDLNPTEKKSIFQVAKQKFAKSVDVTADDDQQRLDNINAVLNKIYSFFIKKDNEEKAKSIDIPDFFGNISNILGNISNVVSTFNSIKEIVGAVLSVSSFIGSFGSSIIGSAMSGLNNIRPLISSMLPRLGILAAGAISSPMLAPVLGAGLAMYGIFTTGKALTESMPELINSMKEGFSGFIDWINNTWNSFSNWTSEKWKSFKNWFSNKKSPTSPSIELPRSPTSPSIELPITEKTGVKIPEPPVGTLPSNIGNASYMSLVDQKRLSQTATSTSMMDKYDEQFKIAGSQTNLDSQLLKTIAAIETGGISADKRESYVVNPNNPNSATGLMQIIGITAKDMQSINDRYYNGEKLDRTDAESSINGTARYIKHRILPIIDKNNVLQGTNVINDLAMLGYSRGPTYAKDSLQTYFDMKGLSYEEGLNLLKSENKLPSDFITSLRDRTYRSSQINAKEGQEYLARASRLNMERSTLNPEVNVEFNKIIQNSKPEETLLTKHLNTGKMDNSSYKLSNSNINVSGLDQTMFEKFQQMATEYKEITGKPIQINSAYRSIEHQEQLYNSMPKGMAAKPGKSMHNFGQAIDIQTEDGNRLDQLGLLNKYGFNRPLPAEPWHVELAGLDKEKIRSGIAPELGNMNIKEPINNIGNMPTSNSEKIIAESIQKDVKETTKIIEKVKTPLDSTASLNSSQQPIISTPSIASNTTTSNGSNSSTVLEESSIFGKLIARISKNAANNFVDNYSRLFIDRSLPVVGV